MSDAVSFDQKLQASHDAIDPFQAAIAVSTKETAETSRGGILAAVQLNRNGGGGGLVGPP